MKLQTGMKPTVTLLQGAGRHCIFIARARSGFGWSKKWSMLAGTIWIERKAMVEHFNHWEK